MSKTTDNLIDPGECKHDGELIFNGLQEDGNGGAFALYTCLTCGTTLSARTLREMREKEEK